MINNFNKKGLSAVVTTLIIILLVFVAIGIVWVVVKNVIEEGASQIDIGAKCISNVVEATSVDCTDPSACDVILKRNTGEDEIGGVKLVFSEGNTGGNAIDPDIGNLAVLNTIPVTVDATQGGLTTPDKVEVTIYFLDDSGNENLCPSANPFNF